MTNKQYICITGNWRHDGLSHCLPKANRASSPIDFYRELKNNRECPLFSQVTTDLVRKKQKGQPSQLERGIYDNVFSNQPQITTTTFRIRQTMVYLGSIKRVILLYHAGDTVVSRW